jgi:hypothetical protein
MTDTPTTAPPDVDDDTGPARLAVIAVAIFAAAVVAVVAFLVPRHNGDERAQFTDDFGRACIQVGDTTPDCDFKPLFGSGS